jgi:DNA-directed RNA polymerase subunit RPC12/RpoP
MKRAREGGLDENENSEEEKIHTEPALLALPSDEDKQDDKPPSSAFISKRKFLYWLESRPGDSVTKDDVKLYLNGQPRTERICSKCEKLFIPSPSHRGNVCGACRMRIARNKKKE